MANRNYVLGFDDESFGDRSPGDLEITPSHEPASVSILHNIDMPEAAMFGRLASIARSLGVPLGWAYCSLLAVFAGLHSLTIDPRGRFRANAYVVLVGPPGKGKTVAMRTAIEALNPGKVNLERTTPVSDRGLINLFTAGRKNEPQPLTSRLLQQDELKNMIGKMAIKGATLSSTLCELWDADFAGASDKNGKDTANVRLSILGAVAAVDAADFRDAFNAESNRGLYDRCVFVPPPRFKFAISDEVDIEAHHIVPTPVTVTREVNGAFRAWSNEPTTVTLTNVRSRVQFIALKISMIAASANGDTEITPECLRAGIKFAEWQETVRLGGYSASKALTQEAAIEEAIVSHFQAVGKQAFIRFRDFGKKSGLYAKYGTARVTAARNAMVAAEVLHAQLREHDNPKSTTGLYCLDESYFGGEGR